MKGLVPVREFLLNSKHIQPALNILGNNKEGDQPKYIDIKPNFPFKLQRTVGECVQLPLDFVGVIKGQG